MIRSCFLRPIHVFERSTLLLVETEMLSVVNSAFKWSGAFCVRQQRFIQFIRRHASHAQISMVQLHNFHVQFSITCKPHRILIGLYLV